MTNQHPITPPLALINKWWGEAKQNAKYDEPIGPLVATQAAQWGADMELEACCALMDDWGLDETDLRFARRPKPPSLKEQALAELEILSDYAHGLGCSESAIRRVLEALPE